uniref:Uncharacterized protein n=1 Tax=Glossina austeni TaxID=7395 RepID=A0A1A9V9U8_GLOAU
MAWVKDLGRTGPNQSTNQSGNSFRYKAYIVLLSSKDIFPISCGLCDIFVSGINNDEQLPKSSIRKGYNSTTFLYKRPSFETPPIIKAKARIKKSPAGGYSEMLTLSTA